MKHFLLVIFCSVFAASPVLAGCIDLTKTDSFSLTRNAPYFKVTNTVSDDGTVTEVRESTRNRLTEQVITTYWNGVIAVDRRSDVSHIQMIISQDAKSANLRKPRREYEYPISLLVNGNEVDKGSFTIKTIEETTLSIDGCRYAVMVVRTSIERNNSSPINEEALLSLDAGTLLGNIAMTRDWQARSDVFFDEINAN